MLGINSVTIATYLYYFRASLELLVQRDGLDQPESQDCLDKLDHKELKEHRENL